MKLNESIIHLDGIDKTGKDTIRSKLVKGSKGKFLVIVRSYISQIAYNRIYSRNIDEEFFKNKMIQESKDSHYILLTTSVEELEKRFICHDEKDLDIKDIAYHKTIFENIYNELAQAGITITKIDTTNKRIDKVVDEIVNAVS